MVRALLDEAELLVLAIPEMLTESGISSSIQTGSLSRPLASMRFS